MSIMFPEHERGGEDAIFINKCHKINRRGMKDSRIFCMSDRVMFLVSSKKIHSKFYYQDLKYIVIAN